MSEPRTIEAAEVALESMTLQRNAWRSEALKSREQINQQLALIGRFDVFMQRYRRWFDRRVSSSSRQEEKT